MNINELITSQQFAEESLSVILLNLMLCMALLSVVSWFYKKYSRSLGGKSHVGSILPLIGLTVFMVITVVKSSLALSLGLVGALSIVRFRTPIKEPEELGYLFLTIAVGLGFGAGFQIITILITIIILSYLYISSKSSRTSKVDGEYTLVLDVKHDKYDEAILIIEEKLLAFKVIRIESKNERLIAYLNISISDNFNLQEFIEKLKSHDSSIDFNLIESGVNW